MSGPPGSGKTLLARTVPSILPPLTLDEALETTKLSSVRASSAWASRDKCPIHGP
jgi:predicted ATPase with chaperone activity